MSTPNPRYSRDDFRKMLELEIQDVKYFLQRAENALNDGELHTAYRRLSILRRVPFLYPEALNQAYHDTLSQ